MRSLAAVSLLVVSVVPGCGSAPSDALVILRQERPEQFAEHLRPDAAVGTLCLVAGPCDQLPDGWLVCEGQSLLHSQYPELGDKVGKRYAAEGSDESRFALPELRGAFVVDINAMLPWWLASREFTHGGLLFVGERDLVEYRGQERGGSVGGETVGAIAEVRWVVKAR